MRDEIPYYHRSLDWDKLMADYPPPPFYQETTGKMSSEEIYHLQNIRFLERVKEAWEIPFYKGHWGKVGLEPGDIRSLRTLPSSRCLIATTLNRPFKTNRLLVAITLWVGRILAKYQLRFRRRVEQPACRASLCSIRCRWRCRAFKLRAGFTLRALAPPGGYHPNPFDNVFG